MKQIIKTITKSCLNHSSNRGYYFENKQFNLMADFENDEFWIEGDDKLILWNLVSSKTYRKVHGIWHNKNVAIRMFNKFVSGELYI